MMRLFAGELGQEARQKERRIEEITIVDGVVAGVRKRKRVAERGHTHGEGGLALPWRVGVLSTAISKPVKH